MQVETKRMVAVMGVDRILKCDHEFVQWGSGSFHFTAGEVWDDIEIEYRCKHCGEEMPEEVSTEIDKIEIPI